MGKIINRVVSTAVIIGVLLTVDVWIVLAICGGVAFTVFLKLWRTKIQFQRDQEMKPVQRAGRLCRPGLYLADYAKEIRLSQVGDVLSRDFDRRRKVCWTALNATAKSCLLSAPPAASPLLCSLM